MERYKILELKKAAESQYQKLTVYSEGTDVYFNRDRTHLLNLDKEDVAYLINKYVPKGIELKHLELEELGKEMARVNKEIEELKK